MTRDSITPEMTLFDITEKHPETIDIFVANGFAQVADAEVGDFLKRHTSDFDGLSFQGYEGS